MAIGSVGTVSRCEARIGRALTSLADRLLATRGRIVREAKVSQMRLNQFGKEVSDYVLSARNKAFPFILTPTLRASAEIAHGKVHAATFSGASKLPYTDPILEVGSGNSSVWYGEEVAKIIGARVLLDYVHAANVRSLRIDSEANFLADVASSGFAAY